MSKNLSSAEASAKVDHVHLNKALLERTRLRLRYGG
jgi:hypothetical protein